METERMQLLAFSELVLQMKLLTYVISENCTVFVGDGIKLDTNIYW